MNMKKNRIPAFLLSVLIAFTMVFTMGATAQNAYADDEYKVEVYGVNSAVPGESFEPVAVVYKGDEKIDPSTVGMHVEWSLGAFSEGIKETYVESNTEDSNHNKDVDPYVQVLSDDSRVALIKFIEDKTVEDPDGQLFGLTAELMNGSQKIATSDTNQFLLENEFDDVQYSYDPEYDPYLLPGSTQFITVTVLHHKKGEEITPTEIECNWATDNNGIQIQESNKNEAAGSVTFACKRVDSSKDTEAILTITNTDGKILDNLSFWFYAISTNLADYQIEFNDNAEDPFVFINHGVSVDGQDSTACKITVVSGKGDGYVLPKETYDLKIQKVIGYNESNFDDILQNSSFPLKVDPANSFSLNGNRTDGTAQYVITAVAKSGSGFTGQTGSETGRLYLLDRQTITWPAVNVGFPEKNFNYDHMRYEVTKGKKLKPFATSVETSKDLTLNKDYVVRYINKKTKKVYSSFPTKLGEYSIVFTGVNSYYGIDEGIDLLIGKKNPIKAKGKTIICKTKLKKGKTKKTKSFKASKAVKVTKAKGVVSYSKVKGNKNITVSDSGKVKVKKGTKKGTYKIKVKVTAQGTSSYIAGSKTVTVKVKVRK